MTDYHESWDALADGVRDAHRALTSFKEELEAVDWYHQRVAVCNDAALRGVLEHNRDEEIEHACMTLEWLRRNMPGWDVQLRRYLFTDAPITEIADTADDAPATGASTNVWLPIGSLKR